jgi:hypothetical protein
MCKAKIAAIASGNYAITANSVKMAKISTLNGVDKSAHAADF